MLNRNLSRMPLTVIVVTSAVAFLCTVAAVVYAAVSDNTGFGMADSYAQSCSNYLALKTERNRSLLYSAAFVGSSSAVFFLGSAAALSALLCVANRSETHAEFPQFTFAKLCGLYLLLSLAAVALVPGVGNHLTLIVEKGVKCTETIEVNSIIFLALLGTALLLTLTAWIFLFLLNSSVQDQVHNQEILFQPIIPQPQKLNQYDTPPMKDYLNFLMIENKLQAINQPKTQIKQPLLEQIDSNDIASEQNDLDKIIFVGYSQYKHKQELINRKQVQQQKKIQQFLLQQALKQKQLKRIEQAEKQKLKQKKNKLSNRVLSPDDPDFELMVEQSEDQPKEQNVHIKQGEKDEQSQTKATPKIPQNKLAKKIEGNKNISQNYPANYIPKDEQDQKRYKDYKKKVLKIINSCSKKNVRHPQNIQGGRSKRLISKYLQQSKRPVRNEQLYLQPLIDIDSDPQLPKDNTVVLEVSSEESQQGQSAISPKIEPEKEKQIQQDQDKKPQNQFYFDNRQQIVQKVHFSKEKTKSPLRKQLFQQSKSNFKQWNSTSILGKIYSGVVQSAPKARLNRIRSEKEGSKSPKRTKEKIIQSIRYKAAL